MIYRFRISFEDYDDVIREIDVLPRQTFLDLHQAIHKSLGYDPEVPSSFYSSNDQWKKGREIAYLPSERKSAQKVDLMENARLSHFIDDPHQKFYYTYNFSRPYDFHVQLIRILKQEEGKQYPALFKSAGSPPRAVSDLGSSDPAVGADAAEEDEEFDFLHEQEYASEDSDDMDLLDDEQQEDDMDAGFSGEDQEDY